MGAAMVVGKTEKIDKGATPITPRKNSQPRAALWRVSGKDILFFLKHQAGTRPMANEVGNETMKEDHVRVFLRLRPSKGEGDVEKGVLEVVDTKSVSIYTADQDEFLFR